MSTYAKLDPNYALMNNCDPCATGKAALAGASRADGVLVQSAQVASQPMVSNSAEYRVNQVVAALGAPPPSAQKARAIATGYAAGVARTGAPQY